MRAFLLSCSVVMLANCGTPFDPNGGTACTDEARAGLNITVKNGSTGAEICDATVTATDGSYSETLQNTGGSCGSYAGAWERKGTYTIAVSKTGFATATESNVVVGADECHVTGVVKTIELTPQ